MTSTLFLSKLRPRLRNFPCPDLDFATFLAPTSTSQLSLPDLDFATFLARPRLRNFPCPTSTSQLSLPDLDFATFLARPRLRNFPCPTSTSQLSNTSQIKIILRIRYRSLVMGFSCAKIITLRQNLII